jgi:hypothetical protein
MDMDQSLEQITGLAVARGNKYVKGPSTTQDLPEKVAELGIFLLEKSRTMQTTRDEALKHELIEVQNKVDDLRKTLFASKLIVK